MFGVDLRLMIGSNFATLKKWLKQAQDSEK